MVKKFPAVSLSRFESAPTLVSNAEIAEAFEVIRPSFTLICDTAESNCVCSSLIPPATSCALVVRSESVNNGLPWISTLPASISIARSAPE